MWVFVILSSAFGGLPRRQCRKSPKIPLLNELKKLYPLSKSSRGFPVFFFGGGEDSGLEKAGWGGGGAALEEQAVSNQPSQLCKLKMEIQ